MRIVSLLPSATEILFALGLDEEIVGVSHECDFPLRAKTKTAVVSSRLPKEATPAETDRLVREHVERGESIYAVNRDLLEELAPDLIFTQDLGDVWRDILWIGEATGRRERAQQLVTHIGERLGRLKAQLASPSERPRVAVLEWLQPFYVGGHWVPEMVEHAGGVDVLGKVKTPSRRVSLQEIVDAAPEVILIAPCGYVADQARDEYMSLTFPDEWYTIPAVRDGRIFALDANGHVSRPAGRLVTGIESMAKALHPQIEVPVKAMLGMLSVPATGARNRAAVAGTPTF